jgi:hypothetical protein
MNRQQKKPGVAFWATVVVVVVLVAYPLSLGPACWLTAYSHHFPDRARAPGFMSIYLPLGRLYANEANKDGGPTLLRNAMDWWCCLLMPRGFLAWVPYDDGEFIGIPGDPTWWKQSRHSGRPW